MHFTDDNRQCAVMWVLQLGLTKHSLHIHFCAKQWDE